MRTNALNSVEGTSMRNNDSNRSQTEVRNSRALKATRAPRQGLWRNPMFVWPLLFVVIVASFAGTKTVNVLQNERKLKELHADYAWSHTTFDRKSGERPNYAQGLLAKYLGNALVSDFSKVSLEGEEFSDDDLSFLGGMKHLRSLEIKSDSVTDDTLKLISRLPDLRYLSLAGNQFSVYGLLHLRHAHQLKQLKVDVSKLSPAELAVLQSQLPDVKVKDASAMEPNATEYMFYPAEIIAS